ncbi:Cro/CI family transcriptional regulator [Shewanella xiamenensis]|uniref:Cro/CI family transcriptional regulator n=1 Tax=Shewanella xiamenensis TaxID=332186 RepID=UPI0021C02ADF|nr:Cro/CI family transcriptional regulator [Shewanella xiamenensis]MCT8866285.1 Cro/Cl family transcriptional regulator [Shewanella xiamenensis]
MKTSDAVQHFNGKSKLAKALGINPASVSQWGDDVPALRAFQIERLTDGKLKAGALQLPNANQAA